MGAMKSKLQSVDILDFQLNNAQAVVSRLKQIYERDPIDEASNVIGLCLERYNEMRNISLCKGFAFVLIAFYVYQIICKQWKPSTKPPDINATTSNKEVTSNAQTPTNARERSCTNSNISLQESNVEAAIQRAKQLSREHKAKCVALKQQHDVRRMQGTLQLVQTFVEKGRRITERFNQWVDSPD